MLRRLIEAHYFDYRRKPSPAQIDFWLRELRTPEILIEVAQAFSSRARQAARGRPLLAHALTRDAGQLEGALEAEQRAERDADRSYWKPLKAELESLRRQRHIGRAK